MAGLLGSIFNSGARDEQRAKLAYEHAEGYRKRRMVLFRQSAMNDIVKSFPDAAFLMNMRFPSFVAYSRDKSALLVGTFADLVFPRLDYVSHLDVGQDATRARLEAIDRFENLVSAFDQMASENFDLDGLDGDEDAKRYVSQIVKKGYYILKVAPSEMAFRCEIQKNEECLGHADWWSPRNIGYFHDIIRNNISNQTSGCNKISHVDVRIDFLNGSKRNYFIYHFMYNEMHKYNIAELREEFLAELSSLGDFFSKIEHEFQGMPDALCDALDDQQKDEVRLRLSDRQWRDDETTAYMGRLD